MNIPAFLITIDTEGDNLWINNREIRTNNASYLERFQSLCERFEFKPVWLTNYEMAKEPIFIELAKDIIARGQGEIGMHLHAWNNPPEYDLTGEDWRWKPYLIEFPIDIMRKKILYITRLLEDTFYTEISSHRAGRWAFNSCYAKLLIECGYKVDCSVTPYINWNNVKTGPRSNVRINYQFFPDYAYFVDTNDISKPGSSSLLEVPVSIRYKYPTWFNFAQKQYNSLRGKQYSPSVNWLRPSYSNIRRMISVIKKCLLDERDYIEFMLHSSELMPNGSPKFKDVDSIERLYDNLEELFEWISGNSKGMTLNEFYQKKSLS